MLIDAAPTVGSGGTKTAPEAGARSGPAGVHASYAATPEAVAQLRACAAAFAAAAGAGERVLEDVRLAVSEAATNVVQHAYRFAPGEIRLAARVREDAIELSIADDGGGFGSREDVGGLGLGIPVMNDCADELTLERASGGGCVVRMRFDLAR